MTGGVIFDCDGVLVDSEPLSAAAMAASMRAIGLDASTEDAARRFTGLSLRSAMDSIAEQYGGELPGDFAPGYRTRLYESFERELAQVRGVAAAIDEIEAAGLATCVASSGEHERIAKALGLTGLAAGFEGRIFSATEVERGKPAPDLFLHAARQMGWEPRRCVVVEDSEAGALAGAAAGMTVFGYAERTSAELLERAGARAFDSMHELPGLIARLGGGTGVRGTAPGRAAP